MNLHLVIRRNASVPKGAIVDKFFEGYQEMLVRTNPDGTQTATLYKGDTVVPHEMLDDFVIKLKNKGGKLDERLVKRF